MEDHFFTVFIIFAVIIGLIFILVFGVITVGIVKGLSRWSRNNGMPVVTVPAVVVGKRGEVSGGSGDSSASTSYHATFELQGSERLEFRLSGPQYGLLAERDRGALTYQGTRYKGFARTPQDR